MATLLELRFLILVLTGLAVCIGSTTSSPASTTVPVIVSEGGVSADGQNSPIPPTQQNTTANSSANTSEDTNKPDSPHTVSNETTASPSLTPSKSSITDTNKPDSPHTVSNETAASPSLTPSKSNITDTNKPNSPHTVSSETTASPSLTPSKSSITDTNKPDSPHTVSNETAASPSLTPSKSNITDTNKPDSPHTVSNETTASPSLTPSKSSITDTNKPDSPHTVSSETTALPSLTPSKSNITDPSISDSTSNVSHMTTPSLPLTESNTTGNQSKAVTDSSDFASTVSTNNTTSPTSTTPVTTVKPLRCEYTIEPGMNESYAFKVKLENINTSQQYSVMYMDNDTIKISEDLQIDAFRIPFKELKPCRKYFVRVIPDCKPPKKNFHVTEGLNDKDIKPKLNYSLAQVCFETKWNLTKCMTINPNESCTKKNLTFENDPCNKTTEITLPPSKEPVINHEKHIPTKFTVNGWPKQCPKISVSCNETLLQNLSLDSEVPENKIKPFHLYTCRGLFDYYGDTVQTKSTQVKIICDMPEPTFIESNTSITSSWNLVGKICPNSKLKANVTCSKDGSEKNECSQNGSTVDCAATELKLFQNYNCIYKAMYLNHTFLEKPITKTTLPGKPTIMTKPLVNVRDHNAFDVTCDVENWNGLDGYVYIKLYLGETQKHICNDSSRNKANFHIKCENLYYSSNYTLKIYAVNKHGFESDAYIVHAETKYNVRAVLGFLGFLIVLTSLALLFVLYKIYLLKRKTSRDEREMDDLLPPTTLLPVDPIAADALVETYKEKIADEGRLFMEEFQSIPRIFSNYTVKEAKKAENQSKNRYVDILPYDYNRVPLSNGGRHDYINASFIEGYKESNKYIAAQGPKEETVGDFWRMTWEQNTSIIVMVTRCEEGNKNKCAQYWPAVERETEIFDDFVVKIKGEENCPDYIIRHLSVMNRKEKTPEREVTHIQFTSWPDHGVPGDPGLLLKLRRRVNSFKNVFSGPIVIHCSAGVGRTGTYICIDAMIESLEAEGRVDIYGYVAKLRRQRCLMVQVEAQYVLIHTALIEYNQFGETEISLTDFHSAVNTLRQKEGSEPSLLEMEFQKLPKFKNWRTSNTASTEENKKKNRNSSVVPYDFNRVLIKLEEDVSNGSDAEEDEDYSSDEEDETPTKYINASYLDGYWCPKGLIAAQGPLSDTVADFLQMLYQHRVKTVVMLSDCTENGQEFCSQYWNDEKKEFGEMVVEVKETDTFPTYIRRSLEIQHTKRKESHTTEQYQFLKWEGNELPPKPCELIDMMKSIRQNGGYENSGENRGAPIVAHCNDGSSRSGIFCALWNILDSADTEKLVDVFQVSKHLRKERQGMINSVEQYQFLYAALEVAFPVQNGEVKKSAATPDTVQVINEQTSLISATSEDQEGTESSQQVEQKADAEATEAAKPAEPAMPTETAVTSEQTEKVPSESTTNGPTVSVEV